MIISIKLYPMNRLQFHNEIIIVIEMLTVKLF